MMGHEQYIGYTKWLVEDLPALALAPAAIGQHQPAGNVGVGRSKTAGDASPEHLRPTPRGQDQDFQSPLP